MFDDEMEESALPTSLSYPDEYRTGELGKGMDDDDALGGEVDSEGAIRGAPPVSGADVGIVRR